MQPGRLISALAIALMLALAALPASAQKPKGPKAAARQAKVQARQEKAQAKNQGGTSPQTTTRAVAPHIMAQGTARRTGLVPARTAATGKILPRVRRTSNYSSRIQMWCGQTASRVSTGQTISRLERSSGSATCLRKSKNDSCRIIKGSKASRQSGKRRFAAICKSGTLCLLLKRIE